MLHVPGYQTGGVIWEDPRHLIYRGRREDDKRPVLIKAIRPDQASDAARARLAWEYELTREPLAAKVLRAIALVHASQGSQGEVLVLEDAGGDFLRNRLRDGRLDVASALAIDQEVVWTDAPMNDASVV